MSNPSSRTLSRHLQNKDFTNDIAWIVIKGTHLNSGRDIFVGTVYFSPDGYENKSSKDYITNLEKEVHFYKNKGEVIIQGDFNARTENSQETIECSKCFDNSNITEIETN